MMFLWILIVSLFGALSVVVAKRETSFLLQYAIRFVIYLLLMFILQYNELYVFDFPRTGTWILLLFCISCCWDTVAEAIPSDYVQTGKRLGAIGSIFSAVVVVLVFCSGSFDCHRAESLYRRVEKKRIATDAFKFDPVDETHIRAVPKHTAFRIAQQHISQGGENYGAHFSFEYDTMNIQRVNGRLYWVAPMEFGGYRKQDAVQDQSPGFIMISAENPNEKPRLVTNRKLRYMVHSWYSYNLMRHLYSMYPTRYFTEPTLEIDEELKSWQVVTELNRFAGYKYFDIKGVVVVDPETGKTKEYSLDNIPAWIDRVIPEELAVEYFKWWGMYKEGWILNAALNPKEHLKKPTAIRGKTDVWMVYGSDGQPYWFTGFTSLSSKDTALIGRAFMNTRTGRFFYLTGDGRQGSNEERVVADVEAALPKMKVGVYATDPIPYNLYGRVNCWVVSVVTAQQKHGAKITDPGGKLVKIAIVDGDSANPPVIADTKNQALLAFKRQLASQGLEIAVSDSSSLQEYIGQLTVMRQVVLDGNSIFRFGLTGSINTFSCDIVTADAMPTSLELAMPGHQIRVQYSETDERIVTVNRFTVYGRPAIQSPNQKRLDETRRQQGEIEKRWDQEHPAKQSGWPLEAPSP